MKASDMVTRWKTTVCLGAALVCVALFAGTASGQSAGQSQLPPPGYDSVYDPGYGLPQPGYCDSCNQDWGYDNCYDACGVSARVEYLMWWSHGRGLPPLATTSPTGTPRVLAGRLDQNDTTVRIGDSDIGQDMRSGGRVTLGRFLDASRELSVNGRFWGLEDGAATLSRGSVTGDPILARPFFNTVLGQQDALLLAFPGVAADGSIGVRSHNEVIGADVYLRSLLMWDDTMRMDFLIGYQFTRMDDSLFIESNSTSIDPLAALPVGTTLNILDSFRTQNEFHGGQIGLVTEYHRGRVWFEVLSKIALGNMRQRAILSGQTSITEPLGVPSVDGSGFLVQPSNSGDFTRNQLAFIPEVGLTMGYHVTQRLSLTFGYSFLDWSDAVLAGDQVDLQLDLSTPPPAGGPPVFRFRNNDFWVMGMNFGAEYRF
jgi:hypothetical protein